MCNMQLRPRASLRWRYSLRKTLACPTGWTEMESWDENHFTWDMENKDRTVVRGRTIWHVVGSEQWSYTLALPRFKSR
jgi:hypothetical protein